MGIRAFLNYMVECEVIKNNPAHKVKRQKEDVKIDVFTDEQIRQMLSFYRRIKQREKSYVAYRDYLMIVLILGTGIRRGVPKVVKFFISIVVNFLIDIYSCKCKATIPPLKI
jgi:integrase/recombinase XerD